YGLQRGKSFADDRAQVHIGESTSERDRVDHLEPATGLADRWVLLPHDVDSTQVVSGTAPAEHRPMARIRSAKLPGGDTVPVLGQGTWRMGEDNSKRKSEVA